MVFDLTTALISDLADEFLRPALGVSQAVLAARPTGWLGHADQTSPLLRACRHRTRSEPGHNQVRRKLSIDDQRGACQRARIIAPQPCIRSVHRGLTMMQSCASAARLRGGGPILRNGATPWSVSGDRHLGLSAETGAILFARLQGLVLSAFSFHAARKTTPAGTSPVVTMRHRAISSFLARATIRVLRVPPRASAVRARYHFASALSF